MSLTLVITVKTRGRPKGSYIHPDGLFKQFITSEPTTPEKVRREIKNKYNLDISWITILKRLDIMAISGVIEKRRIGRYHIYMRINNEDKPCQTTKD